MAVMLKKYNETIVPRLMNEFSFSSVMQVPRLKKIVVNTGIGKSLDNKKYLDFVMDQLKLITGQCPVKNLAKKSIANFKLREGVVIGCKVTLRKKRMYEFLDRLIGVVLPRVRDFRGLSFNSFDGYGNYSFGVKDHIIFPEVDTNAIERSIGMDITFVTSVMDDVKAKSLLKAFGMPFRNI